MCRVVDISGQTFGRVTVVTYAGKSLWLCRCVCGTEKLLHGKRLRTGRTQSCGCLRADLTRARCRRPDSLPNKHPKEYRTWIGLKHRCLNLRAQQYASYGGRGIKLCDRWLTSFETFFSDVGPAPSPKHSLDRIDNDGDYEPSNCRWATAFDQANNRRNTIALSVKGERRSLGEHARDLGANVETLRQRIRRGWSDDKVAGTPIGSWTSYAEEFMTLSCALCESSFKRQAAKETWRVKCGSEGPFCGHACATRYVKWGWRRGAQGQTCEY